MIDLALSNDNESILSFYPSTEISSHIIKKLKIDWSCLGILINNPQFVTDDILKYVCEKFIENKSFSNDILTILTLQPVDEDSMMDRQRRDSKIRIENESNNYLVNKNGDYDELPISTKNNLLSENEPNNLEIKDPLETSSSELFSSLPELGSNINSNHKRSNKIMLEKLSIKDYTEIIKLLLRKSEWGYKTEDDKNKILTVMYDLTSAVQVKLSRKERLRNRTASQIHNEKAKTMFNSAQRRGSILMARKLWKEGSAKIMENMRNNNMNNLVRATKRPNAIVESIQEKNLDKRRQEDTNQEVEDQNLKSKSEFEILQEFYQVLSSASIFLIKNLPNVKILTSLSRYFKLFAQVLRIEGGDHSSIMKLLVFGDFF